MRPKTRKALNRAGIKQEKHYQFDDYGNQKKGPKIHIPFWLEPFDYRVWIALEDREPSRSGEYVVRYADEECGRVDYNKKAGFWQTGSRITHWSKDDRAYESSGDHKRSKAKYPSLI